MTKHHLALTSYPPKLGGYVYLGYGEPTEILQAIQTQLGKLTYKDLTTPTGLTIKGLTNGTEDYILVIGNNPEEVKQTLLNITEIPTEETTYTIKNPAVTSKKLWRHTWPFSPN